MTPAVQIGQSCAVIAIGGIAVRLNTDDAAFLALLKDRYHGFVGRDVRTDVGTDAGMEKDADCEFEIELVPPSFSNPDEELLVSFHAGLWRLERGDFRAEFDPVTRRGRIRQSANRYSIDAVLRIVHTLLLARQGGFLLHSASAIRNGKAFLFAGVSGAGKTTISRLAPADATLLTDEISYVRKIDDNYVAFGTPFTGELAKLGENCSAPVSALYLLAQGPENRIDPVPTADAGRELLANTLFFADDADLVGCAFAAACDFVNRVPVFRLTFVPTEKVWEMIG